MVKRLTLALSILLLLTVYPHTTSSSFLTGVPTQQRYKQNNKQQFSYHTLQQATFVTMPSDSEEPKQKKVKTDESAAVAAKSEEDVSVDVQRNDDGTCLYIILSVLQFECIAMPTNYGLTHYISTPLCTFYR